MVEKHRIHEKYRKERSAELFAACDITGSSMTVIYYDAALRRRYARSVMFGVELTPENAAEELLNFISESMDEYSIKRSAIKRVGIAAPVHVESALERNSPFGFDCEVLFVPYISAGISGRFTASLLTLPQDEDWAAASFGKELCMAHKVGNKLHCAAFELTGSLDGSALESGMPAENGSIAEVRRETDKTIVYEVTGDGDSIGISPGGAVSAAYLMQQNGIIDGDGTMVDRDLLYIGEDFFVSQNDIRAIQTDKARCAAAFELLPWADDKIYFSGEPFASAVGFRMLMNIGAVPERFKNAAFCRNSAEQGIIAFLEDEKIRALAFEITLSAKDFSRENLLKYDKIYLNNLGF